MTAKVILNPYSARWEALRRAPDVEAALQSSGIRYELAQTEAPGHAITLTAEAVTAGFSPIIAAGGDGLIGEVVNGLAQAAGQGDWTPMGIMPLGTANDLVDNLRLPRDLNDAAKLIATGQTRLMDLCQANERYFVNNAGLGLEPHITLIQQRMTRMRGVLRYLLATLRGVADNPTWEMYIEWEEGEYHGPVTLISIGNCARTGGIFYTVPHADPFDGKLSFVHGYIPTRRGILAVLPKTMKPGEGNYVEHPAVHEIHTDWLRVKSIPPTPMHADGEIVSVGLDEIEFRLIPARLPVLTSLA